jgi:anti-sigma-K factor RskA
MIDHHDELRDNAGPWVLGALDDDEAWRFSAHLDVCSTCRDEVERLRVAAAALPLAAPPVEPPPELKARLMGIVEAEAKERVQASQPARPSRWRSWLGALQARPALAAGLAALLIVAGGAIGFAARGGGDNASARTAVAHVDQGRAPGGRGELVEGDSGAQLRVSNLPAPGAGHVYQVWVVPRPGMGPEPDAVFTVDRQGRGSVVLRRDPHGAQQVLVTEEPDGGSRAPSSQPFVNVAPA